MASKLHGVNATVIIRICIVLYCIVLYCIVLYCIVLYCIVLYCIVLYCISSFFSLLFSFFYFSFYIYYLFFIKILSYCSFISTLRIKPIYFSSCLRRFFFLSPSSQFLTLVIYTPTLFSFYYFYLIFLFSSTSHPFVFSHPKDRLAHP